MTTTSPINLRSALRLALPIGLALTLAACEAPIHNLRVQRFDANRTEAASMRPTAMALALQVTADGQGLTPDSIRQANALLGAQGRLQDQALTITPFTARGQELAPRLAQALARSGAQTPQVAPVVANAERLAEAQQNQWDLELQSEALVVQTDPCKIARPTDWAVHPYYGVGTLGCANRTNVARMASDPRDLGRPRQLDAADGRAAAEAIERYQSGTTRDLLDINFDKD